MRFLTTFLFTLAAITAFAQTTIIDFTFGMPYSEVEAIADKNGLKLEEEHASWEPGDASFVLVSTYVQLEGLAMRQLFSFRDDKLESVNIVRTSKGEDADGSKKEVKKAAKLLKNYYTSKYGSPAERKMDHFQAYTWEVDEQPFLLLNDNDLDAVLLAAGKMVPSDEQLSRFDRKEATRKDDKSKAEPKKSAIKKVKEGLSEAEVKEILGTPDLSMTILDELVLTYGSYMITLVDDRVTQIEKLGDHGPGQSNDETNSKYKKFDPDKVEIGMAEEEVKKMFGEPSLTMTIMDETVWTYGEYMITFKDGKVTNIESAEDLESD